MEYYHLIESGLHELGFTGILAGMYLGAFLAFGLSWAMRLYDG